MDDNKALLLAQEVIATLEDRHETLASCESLTAGLFAATLAGVPGASAVLRGGLITYATDLKATLASVDPALLETNGPVDPETARQMAVGAKQACGSDWAVALTGVAGPAPQNNHPVGEVWIGIAGPDKRVSASLASGELLVGNRAEIRSKSVEYGLVKLLEALKE